MNRIVALVLVALLSLGSFALAADAAKGANGALYFALEDGLTLVNSALFRDPITENPVHSLQVFEGQLFFVEVTPDGECIRAIDLESGEIREVAAPQPVGSEEDYEALSFDRQYGYSNMIVHDGYIYYIGTEQLETAYEVTEAVRGESGRILFNKAHNAQYTLGAAVYRMPVHGGYGVKLISGLGNGDVHMDICGDRIAVASAFKNPIYAYDFTNFMFYDMDGVLLETIANTGADRHSWLYMKDAEFTAIVNAIRTDGETIYASLGDSEGDFASSRLVDVRNVDETLAYEAFYTPAVRTEQGFVVLTTDVKGTFHADGMENSARIELLADGEATVLAQVPAEYVSYGMKLAVLEGKVYLISGENLLVVEGGDLKLLVPESAQDTGIATLEITDIELLPDSDERELEKAELEGYDKETLALMRNEILARHGYPFKKAVYRAYFGSKSWYIENPDFDYNMLSKLEMNNVETIKKVEASK